MSGALPRQGVETKERPGFHLVRERPHGVKHRRQTASRSSTSQKPRIQAAVGEDEDRELLRVRLSLQLSQPFAGTAAAMSIRRSVDSSRPIALSGAKGYDVVVTNKTREVLKIDERGRSYLSKLGFAKGSTLVADPVEGEPSAWIIRSGRVMTDIELAILSNPDNVMSLERAAAESVARDDTIELT